MTEGAPLDEMADGSGHARPHWRSLLGAMFGLGRDALAQRARMLEEAFAEEGITAMLPGEQPVNWRCDPVPLPISATEFAALEAGLASAPACWTRSCPTSTAAGAASALLRG
jgi:uncharacterized circularly permuted ATP-grasp superfamily protein